MLLGFETHHMFVFGPSLSRKSKGCFEFEPHRSLLASFSYKFAVNPGNMRCKQCFRIFVLTVML